MVNLGFGGVAFGRGGVGGWCAVVWADEEVESVGFEGCGGAEGGEDYAGAEGRAGCEELVGEVFLGLGLDVSMLCVCGMRSELGCGTLPLRFSLCRCL